MLQQFEEVFLDPKTADITFAVTTLAGNTAPDKQCDYLPAHKLVLATQSPVFKRLFYGCESQSGNIVITDTSTDVFKEFLRTFYFEVGHFSLANIGEVYRLAGKYEVPKCADQCFTFLRKQLITAENVLTIFKLSIELDHAAVKADCLAFINVTQTIDPVKLMGCSREVVETLLKHTRLDGYKKIKLCIAWAVQECRADGIDQNKPGYWRIAREKLAPLNAFIDVTALTNEQVFVISQRMPNFFTYDQMRELLDRALQENQELRATNVDKAPTSERAKKWLRRSSCVCLNHK